jgi:4-hydroxybenzoyl-CoA thioesterase
VSKSTFVSEKLIRFHHCDPAGIVFYPRYFEMINLCVEVWFDQALGYSFAAMQAGGFGVPTARIGTDFTAPSRLGDRLDFALEVTEVGRTSASLAFRAMAGEELRLSGSSVIVHIDKASGRPVRWPEEIRAKMLP